MDDDFPVGMVEELEQVLTTEALLPSQPGSSDGIFNAGLLFPLQRRRELDRMLAIARGIQPKTIMEIGSDKGGGLYHWMRCIPTVKRVIACEIRGVPYAETFERFFPKLDFLWIGQSSYTAATIRAVSTWLKLRSAGLPFIDVLFIDGDKSYFDLDFDCYLPMMNPRGIVFFHDIQDEAPGSAYWRVVSRGYHHTEIIDTSESTEAVLRGKRNEPNSCAHEAWLRHWAGRSCGVGVIYLESKP